MVINNVEKLQDKLDRNISWRKKELTVLKTSIHASEDQILLTTIRSGTVLLYAHWEGFIKMSARDYLKFLNNQGLFCSEVSENLLVLNLKKSFIDARKSNKSIILAKVVNKILNRSGETFRVDVMDSDIVNTESNLSYEVLEDILFSLGIETAEFELKKNFINQSLVEDRNKIAHGEYTRLLMDGRKGEKEAKEAFENLYNEVLRLMELFKDKVLDAAISKEYLNSS